VGEPNNDQDENHPDELVLRVVPPSRLDGSGYSSASRKYQSACKLNENHPGDRTQDKLSKNETDPSVAATEQQRPV